MSFYYPAIRTSDLNWPKINIPANKKSDERNNRTDITEIIR